jgi:hypothetical protein
MNETHRPRRVLRRIGAVVMWDAGPAWYSLAVIAIAMPCAWAGGRLRGMQLRARADQTGRAAFTLERQSNK